MKVCEHSSMKCQGGAGGRGASEVQMSGGTGVMGLYPSGCGVWGGRGMHQFGLQSSVK